MKHGEKILEECVHEPGTPPERDHVVVYPVNVIRMKKGNQEDNIITDCS